VGYATECRNNRSPIDMSSLELPSRGDMPVVPSQRLYYRDSLVYGNERGYCF
jgi:hypothetical protein